MVSIYTYTNIPEYKLLFSINWENMYNRIESADSRIDRRMGENED